MINHSEMASNKLKRLLHQQLITLGGNQKLRIYGRLNCNSGKRMKRENRVFFHSEQEALDLGFRPCGHCMSENYKIWKKNMSYFEYGETEIDYLKRKCKRLGKAIERLGFIRRETMLNPFEALVHSIVGQQISTGAVKTIWSRFQSLVGEVTPQNILNTDPAAIQKCGLTNRKVGYILGIAKSANNGEVDFDTLKNLTDQEIISKLTALDGIGVWTVEMLLIHSFCRSDVISYNDLAVRRGMMRLYGLKSLNKAQFERYRKRYTPYSSTASIYLWALSHE